LKLRGFPPIHIKILGRVKMGVTVFLGIVKLGGYGLVSYSIMKLAIIIKEVSEKKDNDEVPADKYYIKPRIRR
jgi:hypothetical protein